MRGEKGKELVKYLQKKVGLWKQVDAVCSVISLPPSFNPQSVFSVLNEPLETRD